MKNSLTIFVIFLLGFSTSVRFTIKENQNCELGIPPTYLMRNTNYYVFQNWQGRYFQNYNSQALSISAYPNTWQERMYLYKVAPGKYKIQNINWGNFLYMAGGSTIYFGQSQAAATVFDIGFVGDKITISAIANNGLRYYLSNGSTGSLTVGNWELWYPSYNNLPYAPLSATFPNASSICYDAPCTRMSIRFKNSGQYLSTGFNFSSTSIFSFEVTTYAGGYLTLAYAGVWYTFRPDGNMERYHVFNDNVFATLKMEMVDAANNVYVLKTYTGKYLTWSQNGLILSPTIVLDSLIQPMNNSVIYTGSTNFAKTQGDNDWAEFNNHVVNCSQPNSALVSFQVDVIQPSYQMRFRYRCRQDPIRITNSCANRSYGWVGNYQNHNDLLNVVTYCNADEVLKSFNYLSNGNGFIVYFTCCSLYSWNTVQTQRFGPTVTATTALLARPQVMGFVNTGRDVTLNNYDNELLNRIMWWQQGDGISGEMQVGFWYYVIPTQ